jgi:peroxiredoxin
MITTQLAVDPADFAAQTGWEAKPEGLCRGEACLPAPGALRDDGRLDVEVAAAALAMPVVHDETHGLWAIGPASGGRALSTAVAADPVLQDRDGAPFRLSSLHGRKVVLVAWASWCGCRDHLVAWQRLHAALEPRGLTVVSVALDIDPAMAVPFIDAAAPTHPSLIDTTHVTDAAFGFVNVPMAVWIDEHGMLVRPAEMASVEPARGRDRPISERLPAGVRDVIAEARKIPDTAPAYRAALEDWVTDGADSRFALSGDEVVARSQPRPPEQARAAACFELGQHLWRSDGEAAAMGWWKQAHALFPENWTYKRQAWTIATTPPGAPAPDLVQEAGEAYGTGWLADVRKVGGGEHYYPPAAPDLVETASKP